MFTANIAKTYVNIFILDCVITVNIVDFMNKIMALNQLAVWPCYSQII